jgi:hypothetical protein
MPLSFIFKFKKYTCNFALAVIVSAKGTEDRGFKSRQGVSFFTTLFIVMLFFATLCVYLS